MDTGLDEEDGNVDVLDPSKTVWETIQEWIPPSERDEIRRQIGEALLSELEDLHQELCLLTDIWRDYRAATTSEEQESEQVHDSHQQFQLPEPPNARARLEQEIRFFAECLRNSGSSSVDSEVVHHVCRQSSQDHTNTPVSRSKSASSRPRTARSSHGEEVPLRARSAESRQGLRPRTASRDIGDSVTITTIAEQAQRLRDMIREEIEDMKLDTEFLRQCIDGEHEYRSTLLARRQRHRQPISLSQLRDARAALEKEYLHQAQYRPANAATTTTTTTTAARAPQHAHPQPLKAKRDLPAVRRPPTSGSSRRLPRPTTSSLHKHPLSQPPLHTPHTNNTGSGSNSSSTMMHALAAHRPLTSSLSSSMPPHTHHQPHKQQQQQQQQHQQRVGARLPQPPPRPPTAGKRSAAGSATSPERQRARLGSVSASVRARRLLKSKAGVRQLPPAPQRSNSSSSSSGSSLGGVDGGLVEGEADKRATQNRQHRPRPPPTRLT